MKKGILAFFDISKAEEEFSKFACKSCQTMRRSPDPLEGGVRPNFSCDAHKIKFSGLRQIYRQNADFCAF